MKKKLSVHFLRVGLPIGRPLVFPRRKSGARGLRAILEEVMLDVMYEIPSLSGVTECVVTRDVVVSRGRPQLIKEKKAS